jgi:hypothetical protein
MELPAYNHPMNSTEYIQHRSSLMNRFVKWLLLCGLLGFAWTRPALAGNETYVNNGIVSYPGTQYAYPPDIDATNFINTGSFTINFTVIPLGQPLFETSDTANYTNTGTMVGNTGFQFDDQSSVSGLHTFSTSFNNSGSISCGSINDEALLEEEGGVFEFGLGEFIASATNIVNPGTVDVGEDGLMEFAGQNLNLSGSVLAIEGGGANATGSGSFGLNTNAWDPSANLLLNSAESSPPVDLFLFDSTVYSQTDVENGGTNTIIRAVFIEDDSPTNVSYQVYFGTSVIGTELGIGDGDVTIQWQGAYQDAATGIFYTNYLYLNNDYVLGASTNVALRNGYPDNLVFSESDTPLFNGFGLTPAVGGELPQYPVGGITNLYSFGDIQIVATTESTNTVPNRALTNLVGRIQISASNELNLANAQISGPNYLSVQSPNQFDGSPGALIQSPYSDLNLGVTNGFLTISNLLAPQAPAWNGPIEAWNTRWLETVNGVTNDYRVLIVGSDLTPTTLAQVQNLLIHTTNNLVISDELNVMSTVTADAQNLTFTTNGAGNGATSLDGELNVQNNNIFWATSFPDLVNLTNNGAIRLQNLSQFIGTSNGVAITPGTPVTSATGTLSEISGKTNVLANDTVTIAFTDYTFVGKLTNTVANQIKIAPTFDGTLSNLVAAINLTAGSGTAYSTDTAANGLVTAGAVTNHAFTVTAIENGTTGNSLATTTTSGNLTWNGETTLAGGAEPVAGTTNTISSSVAYDNFINSGLLADEGSTILANNFVSSGTITNGIGSFSLQSLTTTLTNGVLYAGGDISITADSLVTSNLTLQAGRSLTLQATNLLTDSVPGGPGVVTNGNAWIVGGASSVGLSLPVKPAEGDLLGTTITNYAPFNRRVAGVWAGTDYGVSVAGYSNNAAIGRLILDATTNGAFTFNGASTVPGVTNGLYVDYLELRDRATNLDAYGNPVALTNSPNLVIYYAQAYMEGVSVAEILNHANNNHLRWVAAYAGHYSSTNLFYAGVTNYINAALAQSPDIDSSGDGIPNADNPEPVFVPTQVDFGVKVTNAPPLQVQLVWHSIPGATNIVQYATNFPPTDWTTLTNFITPAAPPYAPITNVFSETVTNTTVQKFYRVQVDPNVTDEYGP